MGMAALRWWAKFFPANGRPCEVLRGGPVIPVNQNPRSGRPDREALMCRCMLRAASMENRGAGRRR
jgi:hypothetical protein